VLQLRITTVLTIVFAAISEALFAQSTPLSESLLPNTTQGFFAISNMDTLSEHWHKTQLGHLLADPAMEPFSKDLRRQFEERWSTIHDRLGLTLEDLKEVPGREVSIGLIAPAPGKAALAIIVDVTGKLDKAQEMLDQVTKRQLERGAKRRELQLEGQPKPIICFDLPEPEEEKEAAKSRLSGSTDAEEKPTDPTADLTRQAFYLLTGNLLLVSDNLEVFSGILARLNGEQSDTSLAAHKPFQIVMERCRKDYGAGPAQMRWFVHPLGYAETARAATPEHRRRKGKSILEVMRNQGLDAVQGMGGLVDFASENCELVHRTAIYAPPPYEKSMKMAVLPNEEDFTPQPWVPRDIATYTTLYFDILNAFDNFGSLFDELFGMGEEGVWEETKLSLKEDPNGPQVDLREELIQHLGRRVTMLTDYQLPITTSSERLLFAIEVSDARSVAVAVEKLFRNDPTVRRREIAGQVIWEMVVEEGPPPGVPEITFGDVPAISPAHPPKRNKPHEEEEEEEERKPLLPHAAVTIWSNHLLIASHIDFLLKVIAPAKNNDALKDDVDFRLVEEEIEKVAPQEKCLRFFSRTDEEYRPTYELIRQNKMPESETMLARLLNVLFGEGKKGVVRTQRIDGSQLPEYQIVRRYLGPAGMQVTSEPEGWFLKGFTLSKEAE